MLISVLLSAQNGIKYIWLLWHHRSQAKYIMYWQGWPVLSIPAQTGRKSGIGPGRNTTLHSANTIIVIITSLSLSLTLRPVAGWPCSFSGFACSYSFLTTHPPDSTNICPRSQVCHFARTVRGMLTLNTKYPETFTKDESNIFLSWLVHQLTFEGGPGHVKEL